jgi:hypothetical protein
MTIAIGITGNELGLRVRELASKTHLLRFVFSGLSGILEWMA